MKGIREDWFGQMTRFSTLQDQMRVSILGRLNLFYDGLE